MYSLRALLQNQPVVVAGVVKTVLAMFIILGAITLSGEAVAAIALCIEAVLGLFVWKNVSPATPGPTD